MQLIRPSLGILFLLLFTLGFSSSLLAQDSASVTSDVVDSTGAIITDAEVTVTSSSNGVHRTTNTNAAGEYLVPGLPPAGYDIAITALGFGKYKANNVVLGVAQKARVDAKLQVGTAILEAQLGVELDPLSAGLIFRLGQKLCYRRDYDRALEQLQKALEFDPNFVWTHGLLAQVYAWKGMYEESLAACEKVANLRGDSPYSRTLRSLILAIAGKTDEAKVILNKLKRHPKLDSIALVYLAETYSVLGEKDEAFEFLEAAYKETVRLLMFLGNRPAFDNLRSDPRYADLLRRMGLPQLRSATSPS